MHGVSAPTVFTMLEIFDVFQLVSVYNTPASKETSCWTSVTKLFVFALLVCIRRTRDADGVTDVGRGVGSRLSVL